MAVFRLLLVLLLWYHHARAAASPEKKGSKPEQPVCGPAPKPMKTFHTEATECWFEAAVPHNILSYAPVKGLQHTPETTVTAASWRDLQRIVNGAHGPLSIRLTGSLTTDSPLEIISKTAGLHLSGPASMKCSGHDSPAIVIERCARAVKLLDIQGPGCACTGATTSNNSSWLWQQQQQH